MTETDTPAAQPPRITWTPRERGLINQLVSMGCIDEADVRLPPGHVQALQSDWTTRRDRELARANQRLLPCARTMLETTHSDFAEQQFFKLSTIFNIGECVDNYFIDHPGPQRENAIRILEILKGYFTKQFVESLEREQVDKDSIFSLMSMVIQSSILSCAELIGMRTPFIHPAPDRFTGGLFSPDLQDAAQRAAENEEASFRLRVQELRPPGYEPSR